MTYPRIRAILMLEEVFITAMLVFQKLWQLVKNARPFKGYRIHCSYSLTTVQIRRFTKHVNRSPEAPPGKTGSFTPRPFR